MIYGIPVCVCSSAYENVDISACVWPEERLRLKVLASTAPMLAIDRTHTGDRLQQKSLCRRTIITRLLRLIVSGCETQRSKRSAIARAVCQFEVNVICVDDSKTS